MLFEAWIVRCSPYFDLSRAQKSWVTDVQAISAYTVEVFLKII